MLGRVKKRKYIETFKYQALRDIVKEGGDNVSIKARVKEQRRDAFLSITNYFEDSGVYKMYWM